MFDKNVCMKNICVFSEGEVFTTINNEKIIELSTDDYLFLTEDLETMDKASLDKGIKYLVYNKKQRMIDTVRSVMNNELTEIERNIAEDYWCNNILVGEIAEKYKLSRSGLYRTVDVIKEKMNMYLKYVVIYNNECPPTKGDFLSFLKLGKGKGEFFEN